MDFAAPYLEKQAGFTPRIPAPPDPDLGFIVVIPCYNESGLIHTLESLWSCERPEKNVEVLVVLNAPEHASLQDFEQNKETLRFFQGWDNQHHDPHFKVYVIDIGSLPKKYAGAGMARKIGMDEAVARFGKIGYPDGIICSMDADTLCDPDYFTEIEKSARSHPGMGGGCVYFEHPITGTDYDAGVYEAVALYELHMRYFLQALQSIRYPYAFHTLGSAFFVTAQTYSRAGGMNRRKAGEDFYFLQKVFPMVPFLDVTTTRVIPSPRPSERVPFGTGPWIRKYLQDPAQPPDTYNYQAFQDLDGWFSKVSGPKIIEQWDMVFNALAPSLQTFLESEGALSRLQEIAQNTASDPAFVKRFFQWFNGFQIIKYLNHAHRTYYKKPKITQQAAAFLREIIGMSAVPDDPKTLLLIYRKMERPGEGVRG